MSNSVFNRSLVFSIVASNLCFSLLAGSSALAENLDNQVSSEIVGSTASAAKHPDVDFGPYMAKLQRSIKRCWFPQKDNNSKRTAVVFKVNRKGKLSNLRIVESSGSKKHDQAGLEAVKKAAPFDPLPAGSEKSVDIQYTFDYNVFSGGAKGQFRQF